MKRVFLAVAGVTFALAGCSTDDTMRYDGVTMSAGNAVYANTVMQMVDPWPEGVQDTNLKVPAERPQVAAPESAGSDDTGTDN